MEVKVTFLYLNKTIQVLCKSDEELDKMFAKFIAKINEDKDDSKLDHYIFYYDGKKLGHDSTIEKHKFLSGKREISISVQKKLRIVKCQSCKCNDCIISLNNYLCSYYGCKYGHSSFSIYDNYINIQKIDTAEICCNEPNCDRNQQNYNLGFYKCLTCTKILNESRYFCKEHILSHESDHKYVKFDKKNYICEKHFKKFIKYCFTHHQNICEECEKEHEGDNIAKYESMTPNVEQLKESLNSIETKINTLKIIIDHIKSGLDKALKLFKRYHYIAKDVVGKFELFNKDLKNNRILKSLWNLKITNAKMNNELTKILDEPNILERTKILLDIHEKNKSNAHRNLNETIDYKKEDDEWWKEIEKNISTIKKEKEKEKEKEATNLKKHKIKNK